jgi:tripartite-type tricarboxylate transporter receptor subunit TctC
MRLKTRRVLVGVALLGVLAQAPVAAEDYPSRPITIVVSLAAGSGMDTITRLYADKLSGGARQTGHRGKQAGGRDYASG